MMINMISAIRNAFFIAVMIVLIVCVIAVIVNEIIGAAGQDAGITIKSSSISSLSSSSSSLSSINNKENSYYNNYNDNNQESLLLPYLLFSSSSAYFSSLSLLSSTFSKQQQPQQQLGTTMLSSSLILSSLSSNNETQATISTIVKPTWLHSNKNANTAFITTSRSSNRSGRSNTNVTLSSSSAAAAPSLSNNSRSSGSNDNYNNNDNYSNHRLLLIGDFNRFNELFVNAILQLPDTNIDNNNFVSLQIYNLQCSNIQIGDIQTSWKVYNYDSTNTEIVDGYIITETLGYEIIISPIDIECSAEFYYKSGRFGLIRGNGNFIATISNNDNPSSVQTRIDFNSVAGFDNNNNNNDTASFPINSIDIEYCTTIIHINNLNINADNNFIDTILDVTKSLIQNVIEEQTSKKICNEIQELSSTSTGLLNSILIKAKKNIDLWMKPLPIHRADPLYIEKQQNFTIPSNITFFHFMMMPDTTIIGDNNSTNAITKNDNTDNNSGSSFTINELFLLLMNQAESFLGRIIDDPTSSSNNNNDNDDDDDDDATDLAINVFLRQSKLLNDDGMFVLNITTDTTAAITDEDEIPLLNPLLWDTEGKLTKTKILLSGIKIIGLDTLTTFTPFIPIGNYTIQNKLIWDTLSFDIDLIISIKPSTLSNSIFINPNPNIEIIENITITVNFTNIEMNASFFLAIDDNKLQALKLGSLLYIENLVPCFIQTIYDIQISGLIVSIDDMTEPILRGFVSPGIDRVVSSAMEASLAAFKPTLLKVMPNIFQGPVRDIIKKHFLDNFLMNKDQMYQCPDPKESYATFNNNIDKIPEYIDFRDMLLSSTQSKELGGVGNGMYGTLISRIFNFLQDQVMDTDEYGQLAINKILIRPATRRQSGIPGTFQMDRELFSLGLHNSNRNNESLRKSRSMIKNILPHRILSSSTTATTTVFSSDIFGENIQLGISNIRLNNLDTITTPLAFLQPTNDAYILKNEINIGNSVTGRPFNITLLLVTDLFGDENKLDISIAFDSINILFDLFTIMKTESFMYLPLGDTLAVDCWLAAMKAVKMDANGIVVNPKETRGLSIQSFAINATNFRIGTRCISCESSGTNILPDLLLILEENNAISLLGERLPPLMEEIVNSDSLQTFFDRRINDAGMFCPSNPVFEDAVRHNYGSVRIPSLSAQSIDTLLYTGTLLSQVAFIVFAESQRQKRLEPSDPLSAQNAFVLPVDMRLIDWTDLSGSTGLSSVIDELFNQTRQAIVGSTGDGIGSFFSISDLFEDFLGNDGVLDLELDFGFQQDDFYLIVNNVRIEGMENLALVDLFRPIGPQTLLTSAQFGSLKFEIGVVADSPSTSEPPQDLVVAFSLENIIIDIAVFAAFDLDRLINIQLGSLLDTRSVVQCILSTAYQFEIPEMNITVGNFSIPTFTGFWNDTIAAVSGTSKAIFEKYKAEIIEAIPLILGGVFKESIAEVVDVFYKESYCPNAADKLTDDSFVDFRDLFLSEIDSVSLGGSGISPYGNLFRSAYKFVTQELFDADSEIGLAGINKKLIAKFTESSFGKAGDWFFAGDLINEDSRLQAGGLDALVQIRAYDAYLKNLDTVGTPLALLRPVKGEASVLNNTATIGVNRPFTLGMSLFMGLSNKDIRIKNDLDIRIGMDELRLLFTALVKISENSFLRFPIKDIGNVYCWLSTIPAPPLDEHGVRLHNIDKSLRLTDVDGFVEQMTLDVACKHCTGKLMYEFTDSISSGESIVSVTDLGNGLLARLSKLLEGELLSVAVDRALNDAPRQCPHHSEYDKGYRKPEFKPFTIYASEASFSLIVGFMIVCVSLAFVFAVTLMATKFVVKRRHMNWVDKLSRHQLLILYKQQKDDEERELDMNALTTSMIKSPSIPYWVRWIMPLVILGNIGFFLTGHLSQGASVSLLISIGGETLRSDDFFTFSMAKSTVEIWNAGGQALAMMIFIASFAWPYSKTVITLGLWFAPPSLVSVSKRGSIYLWLDALAKWSFIDIFVLVLTIVCLRVSVQSPDVPYLPDDFYKIDLLVVPKWGLYANMIAQLITQISSHCIIHYHRLIVDDAMNRSLHTHQAAILLSTDPEGDICNEPCVFQRRITGGRPIDISCEPERLCNHAFRRAHRGESDKLVVRPLVAPALICLAIIVFVLIVLGCILPSYSVRILGIIGVLVESGQGFIAADTNYSVISTIMMLFEQGKLTGGIADYIGLGTLSFLVLLTVLIVPMTQTLTLLIQWFAVMNQYQRHRLSVFLEILQAWQYAEVYILAILVASWQLGDISQYLINPYCKSLNGLFGELVYYGLLKSEDAQCLKTDLSVEATFHLLFVGTILLAFINTFVIKAVAQYFHDGNAKFATITQVGKVDNDEYIRSNKASIHQVKVMYTDTFRWLLSREDFMLKRSTSWLKLPPTSPTGTLEIPDSPASSDHRKSDVYMAAGVGDTKINGDATPTNYESDLCLIKEFHSSTRSEEVDGNLSEAVDLSQLKLTFLSDVRDINGCSNIILREVNDSSAREIVVSASDSQEDIFHTNNNASPNSDVSSVGELYYDNESNDSI